MTRLSEAYDFTNEYENEIQPLLKQAWAKCAELNIPCVMSVCYVNKPGDERAIAGYQSIKAAHLCGEERTPASFAVADIALRDGPKQAAFAVLLGGLGADEETTSEEMAYEESAGAPLVH